jgi:hypothetical protein
MRSRPAIIITTLAEYQTRFWVPVAHQMSRMGADPFFVSFDDRSSEMIETAGFPLVAANSLKPVQSDVQAEIFARVKIKRLSFWLSHERLAFGRRDTEGMREKLARSILATEQAIARASDGREKVALVQEVGGFLSVIGSYFAALAAGVDNWFIEPSFFRGRIILTRNSFAAPRFSNGAASITKELRAYLDATLAAGSLVIPAKDAHHYRSAANKVFNLKNFARLAEKARDKYILGKQQEFGFLGNQVSTHLRMIQNSRRLSPHYTDISKVGRFIYYPLHVPGDIALTVRSPEYVDQLALVDFLCRTIPDGYRLVLKEHPAMVGALCARQVLALLRRHDNLFLLPPTTNNYSVMREARCIVTVNSKSGAEAGLLGKRVFVLGDAFYRDAPYAIPVGKLGDLSEMLESELAQAPLDLAAPAHLEWFASAWEASAPGELYVTEESGVKEFTQSIIKGCAMPLSGMAGSRPAAAAAASGRAETGPP